MSDLMIILTIMDVIYLLAGNFYTIMKYRSAAPDFGSALLCFFYCFEKKLFNFSVPAFPSMSNAEYWQVLARPKNITHNAPFTSRETGKSICAKEIA